MDPSLTLDIVTPRGLTRTRLFLITREPVTDAHLVSAERALFRARMDLEAREAEVEEAMRQQAKSEVGNVKKRLWTVFWPEHRY
jgi:hypothetical protein